METGRTIEFETAKYGTICDCCGKEIRRRARMMHVQITGNHAFFCVNCIKDPYQN